MDRWRQQLRKDATLTVDHFINLHLQTGNASHVEVYSEQEEKAILTALTARAVTFGRPGYKNA